MDEGRAYNLDCEETASIRHLRRVALNEDVNAVEADDSEWGVGIAYRPKVNGDNLRSVAVRPFKEPGKIRMEASGDIAKGDRLIPAADGLVAADDPGAPAAETYATAMQDAADGEEFLVLPD